MAEAFDRISRRELISQAAARMRRRRGVMRRGNPTLPRPTCPTCGAALAGRALTSHFHRGTGPVESTATGVNLS
jgi:hypothetical protein